MRGTKPPACKQYGIAQIHGYYVDGALEPVLENFKPAAEPVSLVYAGSSAHAEPACDGKRRD